MANPAKDARDKMQAVWPGASVSARGRRSITHQHPTEQRRFALDTSIGPLHYGVGEDQEIDTAWEAGEIQDQPWLWKMVKNNFHIFLGPGTTEFDAGQIIKYVHVDSGEDVTFEVQQLQWTNDLDQIEAIADPQQVSHTSIVDDTVFWDGAFGPGLDFRWQVQTARLAKYLMIQNAGAIGTPPQFIIDGGNPVLRLQFIFQKSAGIDIYIDDVLWDEKSNNPQTTEGNVEFRLELTGEPLWWFKMPSAEDGSGNESPQLIQRFRKTGANLFIEIRVPWTWLQAASYPIVIDPTIDESITNGNYDAHEATRDADYSGTTTLVAVVSHTSEGFNFVGGIVFDGVAINSGDTVTSAYVEGYVYSETWDDANYDIFGEDEDDPNDFPTESDVVNRTPTSASVAVIEDEVGIGYHGNAYDITSIINEIKARGGWSSGNNIGFLLWGNTDVIKSTRYRSYEGDSSNPFKLHIVYTAGNGGRTTHNTDPYGLGMAIGVSRTFKVHG